MKTLAFVSLLTMLCIADTTLADSFGTGANEFTIDFITIAGDASSANGTDIGDGRQFADPGGSYRMGILEVTNDQWDQFASNLGVPITGGPTDPIDPYNEGAAHTGLTVPANEVSWYEAAQFINWLNTSTGHQAAYNFLGTQGTRDYILATWTAEDAAGGTNLYRHKDALYFLPTEDEWVKAAFWNGTTLQDQATKDGLSPEMGVDANYGGIVGAPWDVGSGSEELNGTFDMMGNVWEWTESPYYAGDYAVGAYRGVRGGTHDDNRFIELSGRIRDYPYLESHKHGFRVASAVPEPATMSLLAMGGMALLRK